MKARKSQKPLKKPVKAAKATPTKTAAAKKKMRLVKPAAKTKPGTTKAAAAPAPAKGKKGRKAASKRPLEVVKRKTPKAKQREEESRAAEAEPEVALPGEELPPDEPGAVELEPAEEIEDLEEVEEVDEVEDLEDIESDTPLISDISEIRARTRTEDDEETPSLDELGIESFETPAATTRTHLKRVIESLIFVSDQAVTPNQLARLVKAKQAEVRELVLEIKQDFEGRGVELVEVGGGYQFRSAAASAPFVRDMVAQRPVRLTRAQLETLALIAYRQPITRPEIDDVRGVDSGSAIKVLLDRDLVKILGRKDEAGRPLLYGTTPQFLDFFGMKNLQDLPTLREFTELSEENRELFKAKMGDIPDLSDPAYNPSAVHGDEPLDEDEVAARGEPPAGESSPPEADEPAPSAPDSELDHEAPNEEPPAVEDAEGSDETDDDASAEADDEADDEADEAHEDDEDDEDDDDGDVELDPEAEAEAEAEIDAELDPDDEEREDDESDDEESAGDESEDDDDREEDEDDDEAVAHTDPEESEEDEERDDDADEGDDREEDDPDEDDDAGDDDSDDDSDEDEERDDDDTVAEADPADDDASENDDDADEDDDDAEDDDEDEDGEASDDAGETDEDDESDAEEDHDPKDRA